MSSCVMRALAVIGLAGGACGEVATEMRAVECNGGPVDVLANGNFDEVDLPWRQDPPNLLCGLPRIMPDTGAVAACLGGGGDGTTNTLSRDIPLPAGAISARLAGRICIATEETVAADSDLLAFDILDGVVSIGSLGRRTNQHGAAACDFTSFTLEAPLERDPITATFRIQSTLDVGDATSFYVDTLTLSVSCR